MQFGHAGAQARGDMETAAAKNKAMQEAGFHVPESFDKLPDMVNQAGFLGRPKKREKLGGTPLSPERCIHIIHSVNLDPPPKEEDGSRCPHKGTSQNGTREAVVSAECLFNPPQKKTR